MRFSQYFVLLVVLLSSLPAQARSSHYRFEIILFEYTNPSEARTEAWPDNPGQPDFSGAIFSPSGGRDSVRSSSNPAINFRALDSSQLRLRPEASVIRRSSGRRVIYHGSWIQSMHSKRAAYPVLIKVGKSYPSSSLASQSYTAEFGDNIDSTANRSGSVRQIDGTIKISIGRYLHVWSDLLYHRPDSESGNLVRSYRHKDHRRMRSKELHYIDNPHFGILIYAWPVKPNN